MVDTEHYHTLQEIQSLDQKIESHHKGIKDHQNRIDHIQKQRESKQTQLLENEGRYLELRKIISESEKKLEKCSHQLAKAKERLPELTTQQQVLATEKEIILLAPQKDEYEEQILQAMEEFEQLGTTLSEIKKFLLNSSKSLDSIQAEVEKDIAQENLEIKRYQDRIDNLISILPPDFKESFHRVYPKYRFKNPLSKVTEQSTCQQCGMTQNRQKITALNQGQSLEHCISCHRIFLPQPR